MAQKELDAVIKSSEWMFEDDSRMKAVDAIHKEFIRWRLVLRDRTAEEVIFCQAVGKISLLPKRTSIDCYVMI